MFTNNLHAKRFSITKYKHNIVSKELYNEWKIKNNRTETFSEFKNYWKLIAEEMIKGITTERDGIRISSIADFYIGFVLSKKKPVDYQKSKEFGKRIYHENWHSDGKIAKLIFGTKNRRYTIRRPELWGFIACRNLKDAITEAVNKNSELFKDSLEKQFKKQIFDENTWPTNS